MTEKTTPKAKPSISKVQLLLLGVGALTLVIILVVIFARSAAPERSVTAYCSVYKQEKTRLSPLPGDAWPSGLFDDSLDDAGEIAKSIGKLETVAPKDLSPSLLTLQKLYQKIHDDPSQAISASMSGGSIDDSLKQFTLQQCK